MADEAQYPLYIWKDGSREVTNWFRPAARLITGFAELQPSLILDLVPAGQPGEFRLFFKGQPRAKTKETLMTQSGWSREAHTDEQGIVKFDMPWKGTYVAEVSVNDRSPGERPGANGPEKYDGVSYVTTTTYVNPEGLPPIPQEQPQRRTNDPGDRLGPERRSAVLAHRGGPAGRLCAGRARFCGNAGTSHEQNAGRTHRHAGELHYIRWRCDLGFCGA